MIAFILADLRRFWSGAVAIIVLLALSVALSSVVTLQERAVRLGTARASDKFDLVIGCGRKRHAAYTFVGLSAAVALASDVWRYAGQARQ
jgi:hypothetical protein